ncbi:prepilin-type N-terminal cleavage/methylation domain-containing protein [Thermosulfurimonas sp.]|uniref:prepilin-type N-terminal cleavage/methylation domain-containing protein n=1 Tax=Thermosulfurimonas sp. TaxID=2080236 RepID=UPI0025FEA3A9|nr:prepilin-type N-terminal cleavage/methylation domain-containing protein [Thermosulfurimonas sp.]
MEVRKKKVRRKEKGFTLVELMIVIAIIAILAAVAISQYSAYKNKAKAKDLIGFARACAMEIVTQCQADSSFNSTGSLESCSVSNGTSKYLDAIAVSVTGFSNCNSTFSVTANGTIRGTSKTGSVTCTYDATNKAISCTAPTVS